MGFREQVLGAGVYSKTKVRPKELSPRELVQEEIQKQRDILKGTGKGVSWWDEKNNCVTVMVGGASYFNEGETRSGNPLRLYADNWTGNPKETWNKKTVGKFIDDFEKSLLNEELKDDTGYWFKRYKSKTANTKGKSSVKGKAKVTRKK
jgi:hypothetical protein